MPDPNMGMSTVEGADLASSMEEEVMVGAGALAEEVRVYELRFYVDVTKFTG